MTEFIVSLEQLQKLADKLEPEPKETYKVKITLPKIVRCKDCVCFISTGSYCAEFHHVMPLDGYCSLGKSD